MSRTEPLRTTRSTSAELQDRIDVVIELLARKFKRAQIIEFCGTNFSTWEVGPKTIDSYIKRAHAQLLEQMITTRTELRSEAVNDLRYLYKKALEADDTRAALAVRRELTDMLALKGPVINDEEPALGEAEAVGEVLPGDVDDLLGRHVEVVALPEPDGEGEPVVVRPTPERKGSGSLAEFGY